MSHSLKTLPLLAAMLLFASLTAGIAIPNQQKPRRSRRVPQQRLTTNIHNELVTVNPLGESGDNGVGSDAISAEGRYVAFTSQAEDLVPRDNNGTQDVFLRDMSSRRTTLVSVNTSGHSGNSESALPTITPNGRFIAFQSGAGDLVPGDLNGSQDIFVRDTLMDTTKIVSLGLNGVPANGGSDGPVTMTPDGRFVAFTSIASNLVANDTNNKADVFIRDTMRGTTALLSVSSSGAIGNLDSEKPLMSRDGRRIVFFSHASNLVGVDNNAAGDVFLRDLSSGTTALVSANPTGASGNAASVEPTFSEDEKFVVFSSDASDLVANDTNGMRDVFVRDLDNGTTQLVSITPGNASGNGNSYSAKLSEGGRYIVFISQASNLVANDTNNAADIFWRDTTTGQTRLISINAAGNSGNGGCDFPDISRDGQYVTFASLANDLSPQDTNRLQDIFLRDITGSTTTLVSASMAGTGSNNSSSGPTFSADAKFILFFSLASNLVPGDTNGDIQDLFRYRSIPLDSDGQFCSAFGKFLFTKTETHDNEDFQDIYVMGTDNTHLVRLTHGGEAAQPYDNFDPNWSPDGKHIVFSTLLHDPVAGNNTELYTMDAKDGGNAVRLTNSPGLDEFPSWSADGRYIVFTSERDGPLNLYVMNADGSGSVRRLTNTTDEDGSAAWSPDGSRIAFIRRGLTGSDIYLINPDGTNLRRFTSADGYEGAPAWSPDSSRIAFDSNRQQPQSANFEIYVMDAVDANNDNEGDNLIRLTTTPLSIEDNLPSWSPDGTTLLFVSNRCGGRGIYSMPASGGTPVWISQDVDHSYFSPVWRPALPSVSP